MQSRVRLLTACAAGAATTSASAAMRVVVASRRTIDPPWASAGQSRRDATGNGCKPVHSLAIPRAAALHPRAGLQERSAVRPSALARPALELREHRLRAAHVQARSGLDVELLDL